MLDIETIREIESFVSIKPRSTQEIAKHVKKSWRTADRYVQEIEQEYGTLATRTFREGTRGALKIVYWASIEKVHSSVFQEILAQQITYLKQKDNFSAFDIYQHISPNNKKATIEFVDSENKTDLEGLASYLISTKKQLLVFSGNLSWINLKSKKTDIFTLIERLAKQNISIKILSRVDLTAMKNVEKMFALNIRYGKENVEIRHTEQPLRALISDGKLIRMKEIKEPTGKINELNKKIFIFYMIKDKNWVDWLSKIFWHIFSNSIDAQKRIDELKKLRAQVF